MFRIVIADDDAFFGRCVVFDDLVGVLIQRWRIVQQKATFQRTKARVEMIEALVDQTQRAHFDLKPCGDFGVGVDVRTKTVSGPVGYGFILFHIITGSFERHVLRKDVNLEALRFEPLLKVRFLSLSLLVNKAAEDDSVSKH